MVHSTTVVSLPLLILGTGGTRLIYVLCAISQEHEMMHDTATAVERNGTELLSQA